MKILLSNHTDYPILDWNTPPPHRNGTFHGLILGKRLPRIPPELELLMADLDLRTLVLSLPRIPPELELLMADLDLRTLVLS